MAVKISDAEFPLMEHLWKNTPLTALEAAIYAKEHFHWAKNTTYTVLKRLVERGALERIEPNYVLRPLVSRKEVQRWETDILVNKFFSGSLQNFFNSFLEREDISEDELAELDTVLKRLRERKEK